MDSSIFRKYGHELVDWAADYMDNVEAYPVMPRVKPGDVRDRLPENPPLKGESMDDIISDFKSILLPGITHWNHPRFFAYFPANNSGPSILAELLSATLGINAMMWQTSPAATELEELVMDWLARMLELPDGFKGVIHDTASTATLCALLCARERGSGYKINTSGFDRYTGIHSLRIYTSTEAHSSVEKGVRIAGFGADNLVKIAVDSGFAMDPGDLEKKIEADVSNGLRPCCICATVGTTSSTANDPLRPIGEISRRHGLWLHVDAAMAGSAGILPEKRAILDGMEHVDSFVFNPHKWLFTNFDCSAFFCRHPDILTSVFSIQPEYLKTGRDREVTNFRDWGIQLGRRFRALKLWFVIRHYGVEGLRDRLRAHLAMTEEFASWVQESAYFELMAPVALTAVCFRFRPPDADLPESTLEEINSELMDEVNRSGRIYITHTRLRDRFCLRLNVGQTRTEMVHVEEAWNVLNETRLVKQWRQNR